VALWDGCFHDAGVVAFDRKLHHGSLLEWYFVGVLSSSRARWVPMLGFVHRGLANSERVYIKKSYEIKDRGKNRCVEERKWENMRTLHSPRAWCSCGSIYSGRSRVSL
jgi:hypothetical protein